MDHGEQMANRQQKMAYTIRWMKGSELHQLREEQQFPPLILNRLSPFFPDGLQRGSIVEVTGTRTSGKTSTSLYIFAESICNQEVCAYVDLNNQFSPAALAQSGVPLSAFSWVRCNGNTEHAMRSADLLLHSGGFGVVLLDLCGSSVQALNRIPLSYWFRFQRAIEVTPTILLVCSEQQQARSCARYSLGVQAGRISWKGEAPFSVLDGMELTAQPRKCPQRKVISIRPESLWVQSNRVPRYWV